MKALLTWLLLAAPVPPQDPPAAPSEPPAAAALLARFAKLSAEQQSDVVRGLERRLQRADDPLLQSIVSQERGKGAYAPVAAPQFFTTDEFAPAATPRRIVEAGSTAHRAATAGMAPLQFLPDLEAGVAFEWRTGAIEWRRELGDRERFANCVRGYAPGADHAVAHVLAALDVDPHQRALAEYFAHLYADRDGRVYAGVPLFDAWNSGRRIEMPDTDGIAFARRVLATRSFTAPIPEGRRRERLYEKIRDAFAEHREHRSLRLCAAATFVSASPAVDPVYEPLVRRCHHLWQQCGRDPAAFARVVQDAGDRTRLIESVDRALAADGEPAEAARRDLADLQRWLRALADHELRRVGG